MNVRTPNAINKRTVTLPLDTLTTDPDYQRPLNQRRVKATIADGVWDPRVIRQPIVNLRDGRYFIVDGQHTVEMARQRGWREMSVELIEPPISKKEEAALFSRANEGSAAVRAYNNFKAKLVADNGAALAVKIICDSLQLDLAEGGRKSADSRKARAIGCVGTLERVHNVIGHRLELVLRVLGEAFGYYHDTFSGPVVQATGRVLAAFPGIDVERLVAKLKNAYASSKELEKRASEANKLFTMSKRDVVIARLIVQAFNHKLAATNRIDESLLLQKGVWPLS